MKNLFLAVLVSIFSAQAYALDFSCELTREKKGERITSTPLKKVERKDNFVQEAYVLVDGSVEADAAVVDGTLILTLGERNSPIGTRTTISNFTKEKKFYASTYTQINNIIYTLACR